MNVTSWIASLGLATGLSLLVGFAPNREVKIIDPAGDGNGRMCRGCRGHDLFGGGLTRTELENELEQFSRGPLSEDNEALETLLYHGRKVREALSRTNHSLPPEHASLLARELGRTTALVSLRVIDDSGTERVLVAARKVPLFEKQHLRADRRTDVQELEFSGTVARVGLHHLWARY